MTATSAQGVNTISWSLSASNGSVITGYEVQFAQKGLQATDTYASWASCFKLFLHLNAALDDLCPFEALTKDDVYKLPGESDFTVEEEALGLT